MPDNNEELQETVEPEATVDLDNPESRMNFLKSQLNDLLDGINNVYGQDLMEELLKRLEKTVEDFNTEVSGLIGKLKAGKIFEEDEPEVTTEASEEPAEAEDQEADDSDIIARMQARIGHE
jgi:hypothetical protein